MPFRRGSVLEVYQTPFDILDCQFFTLVYFSNVFGLRLRLAKNCEETVKKMRRDFADFNDPTIFRLLFDFYPDFGIRVEKHCRSGTECA